MRTRAGIAALRLAALAWLLPAVAADDARLGPPPAPWPDWEALRAPLDAPLPLSLDQALTAARGPDMESVRRAAEADWERTRALAGALRAQLGAAAAAYALERESGVAELIAWVRELALPTPRPSLWRDAAALAPARESTAALSGRFGIPYRELGGPRASRLLQRPLWRHQLALDGGLVSEGSRAREPLTPRPPPPCAKDAPLYAFYSVARAPAQAAIAQREFAGGRLWLVDLDRDGQPELALWGGDSGEGVGLAWANLGGAWKLLGPRC